MIFRRGIALNEVKTCHSSSCHKHTVASLRASRVGGIVWPRSYGLLSSSTQQHKYLFLSVICSAYSTSPKCTISMYSVLQEHHYRLDPYMKKALQNFVRAHLEDYVETDEHVEKEFWVSFFNLPLVERLRELKTGKIGKLVSFAGTVTRTSEVCTLCGRSNIYFACKASIVLLEQITVNAAAFRYVQSQILM